MKTKLLTMILLMCVASAYAYAIDKPVRKDSIIVTFGNNTRIIIYGENRKELDKILKYDLNALLRDLKVKLDSSASDTTYLHEELDGKNYSREREGTDTEYVRIGLKGIHIKDGETEVRINEDGVSVKDDGKDVMDNEYTRITKKIYGKSKGSSPRKGFNMALGFNTYANASSTIRYPKEAYDLRPFPSRMVSLGYTVSTIVARGENARFHLDLGGDFSWYNMMYDGNNSIRKGPADVEFFTVKDDNEKEVNLDKSKLVVPYVNLSLMPTVSFPHSFISYLSAGGYVGYRLGGYTKVKPDGSKDVTKDHKDFYINDVRYGLSAEIGIRHFPDLFVNYDINELFKDNRGPSFNMISFGIRLF